jgi:hypothetical protein
MKSRMLFVVALAALTVGNTGCTRFRNWLHRGSRCGTTTVAPAMMGAPVALGTPYVAPQATQVVVPQATCECVPMCPPCSDPCETICCPDGAAMSSGYWDGDCMDSTSVPTYDSGTITPAPTPAPSGQQTFSSPGGITTPTPGPLGTN